MEREIVELRMQLSSQQASPTTPNPQIKNSESAAASPTVPYMRSSMDQYLGSQEAVASLMELRSGVDNGAFMNNGKSVSIPLRRLENVVLTPDNVCDLFQRSVRLFLTL